MFTNDEKIAITVFVCIFVGIYLLESKTIVKNPELNAKLQKLLPYVGFILITLFIIWRSGKLTVEALHLDNTMFAAWLVMALLITAYVLSGKQVLPNKKDNKKLKDAVRKAFIALIIGFFGRLDLVVAPFFLVLTFSYFSQSDWI